ncbi:AAA family ATPase, partial [Candidatus Micrarchaeota archaeon]|nr:AAA family ATPase [Candidatus Micrarchaeota archaeon]
MFVAVTGNPQKEIELKVQDPDPSHVGRNIVTLDKPSKDALFVTSGDIVEIEGSRKTAAVIWPARTEDEGKGIIRMDNFLRHNAGTNLGERVRVRRAEVKEAKKVVLAPTQEVRIIASGYDRILKKNFIGRPLVRGDSVWISVFGSGFVYSVLDTTPRGIVKVNDFTQFVLKEQPAKQVLDVPRIAYEDIGGLKEQVTKVREMIELPMRHPELFRRLGINPPKGVLLYGPPGTGKTLLAKAVANETNAHFISVAAPALMSKFVGEAEERIRQVFKEAEDNSPSIIFFDEIDAVAPKRDEVIGEVERRVVAQLLASMDGMEARGNVIVIAATNRVNSIDEALRRPGRFDREIEFPVPDKNGRTQVLQIHTRGMPLSKEIDLEYFSSITHGFVGADLEALVKESAMKALRRYLPKINLEEDIIPPEVLENLEVNKRDFLEGLKDVQP